MTETAPVRSAVLLIEDEIQIRRLLRVFLERNGYDFLEASNGDQGIDEAIRRSPDVVLLDLGLPDIDGLTVLKRLREWSQIPILVVSVRGHEDEKIEALNNGADDYITKPFSPGELLARIHAAQRRASPLQPRRIFQSGRLHVDLTSRMVKVDGDRVRLTSTEYSLLHLFVRHAGKVLTHTQILREIWSTDEPERIGQLRVYIAYLRQKLEINPSEPEVLITEPGVGYRLATDK